VSCASGKLDDKERTKASKYVHSYFYHKRKKKNMLYQYSNYLAIYIATQRVFDKAHKVGLRLIETMATFSTRSPMKK
jgi:hypothetical protein